MKRYLKFIKGLTGLIGSFVVPLLMNRPVEAFSYLQAGALAAKTVDQPIALFGTSGVITTITSSVMFLIGALCVLMLILGGFRYAVSGGEATKVTTAKNTVLYAIIGLILATLSYAIVSFIINTLGGNGATFLPGTDL